MCSPGCNSCFPPHLGKGWIACGLYCMQSTVFISATVMGTCRDTPAQGDSDTCYHRPSCQQSAAEGLPYSAVGQQRHTMLCLHMRSNADTLCRCTGPHIASSLSKKICMQQSCSNSREAEDDPLTSTAHLMPCTITQGRVVCRNQLSYAQLVPQAGPPMHSLSHKQTASAGLPAVGVLHSTRY